MHVTAERAAPAPRSHPSLRRSPEASARALSHLASHRLTDGSVFRQGFRFDAQQVLLGLIAVSDKTAEQNGRSTWDIG